MIVAWCKTGLQLRLGCHQATPIATKTLSALPQSFFARPAEQVAPELIGCLLVERQPSGELLWGVIVETEAYSQEEPACHKLILITSITDGGWSC